MTQTLYEAPKKTLRTETILSTDANFGSVATTHEDFAKNTAITYEEEQTVTKKEVSNTIQEEYAKNTSTTHEEEQNYTKNEVYPM